MSRDPKLQQTDVERLSEEYDRNGRWLELRNAAHEALDYLPNERTRARLLAALDALEERR